MTMPFIELKSVLITFGQIKYIRINEFVNILIRFIHRRDCYYYLIITLNLSNVTFVWKTIFLFVLNQDYLFSIS